jgi:predicted alpha/beta-hydrolase family hydrolase
MPPRRHFAFLLMAVAVAMLCAIFGGGATSLGEAAPLAKLGPVLIGALTVFGYTNYATDNPSRQRILFFGGLTALLIFSLWAILGG